MTVGPFGIGSQCSLSEITFFHREKEIYIS